MRADPLKFTPRLRAWFHGTMLVLFASGVAWWLLDHFGHIESDFGPAVHPAAPWLIRIHGAAAMLALIVLGALIPLHIRRSWRARTNRATGCVMIALAVLLVLTGYTLYYAGGETLHAAASRVHLLLGLTLPLALLWHVRSGRRARCLRADLPR